MKFTKWFKFKKPDPLDTVNINDLNDSFDMIDEKLKETTDENKNLLSMFKNLIINAGNSNAEVAASRGDFDYLPDRLKNFDSHLEHIAINISKFPRLAGETNDLPRFKRAIENLNNGDTLLINDEEYDFGKGNLLIKKAINILGKNKPFYDIITDTMFNGSIIKDGKIQLQSKGYEIRNIGLFSTTVDNGFEANTGECEDVNIINCVSRVYAHSYLFESYQGQVKNINVINCEAYKSIHGFISKATFINFINCKAYNMTNGFPFGFISDNIQGATNKAICKDNKAILCNAYNSKYGFMTYSRDMFSTNNANGITMQRLTLLGCSTHNCVRGLYLGDESTVEGGTSNPVYDIIADNFIQTHDGTIGTTTSIEFKRCRRVKINGFVDSPIITNGILMQDIELDIDSDKVDLGDYQKFKTISGNTSIPRLSFFYMYDNYYKIENTVATNMVGILSDNLDTNKTVYLLINDNFTTIKKDGGNFNLKREYSGLGSYVKLKWNGDKWDEIEGKQVFDQKQHNLLTDGLYMPINTSKFIDVVITETTTNKIKMPNVITEDKVTLFIRPTTGGVSFGGFDTANLINSSEVQTSLTFGTAQVLELFYNRFVNKWVVVNYYQTKYV